LENLAAIVLEDVRNAMFRGEFLVRSHGWKKASQFFIIRVRGHKDNSRTNSASGTPSATAIFSMLSMETFRSARSMDPT
jgi:hypothetical protein